MSSVFLDFADELMGHEALKTHLNIVSSLRRTIQALARLGAEVVDNEDPNSWTAWKPAEKRDTKPTVEISMTETEKAHEAQTTVDIWTDTAELQQTEPELISNEPLFASGVPLSEHQSTPMPVLNLSPMQVRQPTIPPSIFGNGWLPYHGEFVDMSPPFEGVYVPQNSFSFRLTERTLATSYGVLLHDENIINDHTKSIFRYTLAIKDRERILTCVRWMLGPGRHRVFKAVDIPTSRVAELLRTDQAHLVECDGEATFSTGRYKKSLSEGPLPPAMLSAIGVQRKLEELGARDVGNDVLELTLSGGAGYSSSEESDAGTHGTQQTAGPTTIRLSLPLLIYNLSLTAICLQVGPGFQTDGLYGAVEASVIPTSFGGAHV